MGLQRINQQAVARAGSLAALQLKVYWHREEKIAQASYHLLGLPTHSTVTGTENLAERLLRIYWHWPAIKLSFFINYAKPSGAYQ